MADTHIHPTAVVDGPNTHVGADTRIWHFVHVMAGAWIGDRCSIGHACYIGNVRIGHGCRVQNHVSIFDGVTLEEDGGIALDPDSHLRTHEEPPPEPEPEPATDDNDA